MCNSFLMPRCDSAEHSTNTRTGLWPELTSPLAPSGLTTNANSRAKTPRGIAASSCHPLPQSSSQHCTAAGTSSWQTSTMMLLQLLSYWNPLSPHFTQLLPCLTVSEKLLPVTPNEWIGEQNPFLAARGKCTQSKAHTATLKSCSYSREQTPAQV